MEASSSNGEVDAGDCRVLSHANDYIYKVTREPGGSSLTVHGQGCEAITGYTAEELCAASLLWVEMIDERDREAVLREFARMGDGDSPLQLEHRIINKNGEVRWIRNVAIPHRNSEGYLYSYDGVISDITDRKRTEQRLALQYAVTHQLAESGSENEVLRRILKVVCDTLLWDWAEYWSCHESPKEMRWEEVWYSPREDLNRLAMANHIHRGSLDSGLAERVLSSGKLIWISDLDGDGNFPRVEADLKATCGLPVCWGGEVVGIMVFISSQVQQPNPQIMQLLEALGSQIGQFIERKCVEEKLRINMHRLTRATRSARIGVWEFDVLKNQLTWSDEMLELYGVRREDFEGTYESWKKCVLPEDEGIANAEVLDAMAGKRGLHTEFRVRWPGGHADGDVRHIEAHATVIPGDDGKPQYMTGVNWDITERIQAERRLKKAYDGLAKSQAILKDTELQLIQAAKMESIGTLAAGVAHEVKNPLQTMLQGLAFLEPKVSPESREAQAIKDMEDAVTRADVIVKDLLVFAAKTPINVQQEDLNCCIQHALDILRYDLTKSQTNLEKNLSGNLPVLVDKVKIEQVLINLVMNSLQAMSNGGTLTITSRLEPWSEALADRVPSLRRGDISDTLAVVEVQDTGHGIPEELLPKVFDPFLTTKPTGQGTGMGLAVVKRIVDLHEGSIEIQNAPSGGVLVRLILKIVDKKII